MLLWVSSSFSEFIIKPAFVVIIIFLFFSFTINNLTIFFLRFERTLIPILYTIIQDGMRQERLKASFYMFFIRSLDPSPTFYYFNDKQFSDVFLWSHVSYIYLSFLFILIVFAFIVKIPVFFFHAWLPKAHVEASN